MKRALSALGERELVLGIFTRDESKAYPWCHNVQERVSRRQAMDAHAKGKGFYRAISPPFLHGGWQPRSSPPLLARAAKRFCGAQGTNSSAR